MKRLIPLAFVIFFLIANRGAYKGFFDGDDLDNLAMTHNLPSSYFAEKLVTPQLDQSNFRPVGHALYHFFGRQAGLNFPLYIGALHTIHLLNVFLLWLVLRALGFAPLNAAFGLLLFAFNMGAFEIYWKPMYIFDLLCATFTLTSLLLWLHNRWVLSLIAFWCAFKSKEVAIALPVMLAALEFTRGTKRFRQIIPFVAVSLNFGIQAAIGNRGRDNDYTLRFTWNALKTCVAFYGHRILIVPYGTAFVAALLFVNDKRARFGVVALLLFMAPMLFLPGRLFGAYLYVPLIGLSIAAAAFSTKAGRITTAAVALIWLPLNYREMQHRRKEQLTIADENRAYMTKVQQLIRDNPRTNSFIFDRSPEGLHSWGVRAAVRYALLPSVTFHDAEAGTPEALALLKTPNLAFLMWDPTHHHFNTVARQDDQLDAPYIAMNAATPLWQFDEGWHGLEATFKWTNIVARAHLARPAGSTHFEVLVNVGPLLIEKLKKTKLEIMIDGVKIGEKEFETPGWRTLAFEAPTSTKPMAQVEFKSSPGFFYEDHNPADALGIAVSGFGFPTPQYPAVPPPVQ